MFQQQAFLDGYLDKSAQSVDMLARGKAATPAIKANLTDPPPPFHLTASEQGLAAPKARPDPVAPSMPLITAEQKPKYSGRALSYPGQEKPKPSDIMSSEVVPPRKYTPTMPSFRMTPAETNLARAHQQPEITSTERPDRAMLAGLLGRLVRGKPQ